MKKVVLVDRSFASALGASVPTAEACGYMVVNIGASSTEISEDWDKITKVPSFLLIALES